MAPTSLLRAISGGLRSRAWLQSRFCELFLAPKSLLRAISGGLKGSKVATANYFLGFRGPPNRKARILEGNRGVFWAWGGDYRRGVRSKK